MKLTDRETEAFTRLKNSDIESALKRELKQTQDTLLKATDGTTVRLLQGKGRFIEEILSTIDANPGKRQ